MNRLAAEEDPPGGTNWVAQFLCLLMFPWCDDVGIEFLLCVNN